MSSTLKFLFLAASFVATVLAAGCGAIGPARMALPPSLQTDTERIVVTGMGAAPRGEFTVADARGTFSRSASRLALFDALFEGEKAMASFNLTRGDSRVSARCDMRRRTVNAGILTHEVRPLAYACQFDDGVAPPAQLSVREARRATRLQSMRSERSGEIVLGNTRLQLRSSHALAGTPLETAAPIGYLFERRGRTVAAVEVNGGDTVIFLPTGGTGDERQAIVLASLALALLWDPQETGLAD